MKLARCVAVLVFASIVGLASGCSKPLPDGMPKLTRCSVKLTSDGQPVEGVAVSLVSPAGGLEKWPSAGKTDASGVAKIVTYGQYPGAPAGEYKVVLNKMEIVGEVNSEDGSQAQTEPIEYYSLVGIDYTKADATPLSIKIVDGESVSETFEIGPPARELIDRIEPGKGM